MRSNIAPLVDELGRLSAQISDMETRARTIKNELIEAGEGAYEGRLFRASVSHCERNTLDQDAVRAKLTPQFITRHTRTTPVWTVRVVARNGKERTNDTV